MTDKEPAVPDQRFLAIIETCQRIGREMAPKVPPEPAKTIPPSRPLAPLVTPT